MHKVIKIMKPILIILLAAFTLTACTNYGKKVKKSKIEVYYKDGITEEEAQQTADYIYELDTNPSTKDNKKSFQLMRDGDTIQCKMVVKKDRMEKVPVSSFAMIGSLLSSKIFNDKPVNLILSDNHFKAIKTVYFDKSIQEKMATNEFGQETKFSNIEVFINDGYTKEDGMSLAKFLNTAMNPSNVISFQLKKNESGQPLIRMATAPGAVDNLSAQSIHDLSEKISKEMYNGSPLVFELTDTQFNTLKSFPYTP